MIEISVKADGAQVGGVEFDAFHERHVQNLREDKFGMSNVTLINRGADMTRCSLGDMWAAVKGGS